jgi:DNA invertase Pin-like site-specific DNA recombinase
MLKALDRQWLDLTTPLGKGILAFLSALAEDERARILARATSGRAQHENEASAIQPSCGLWSGQARLPRSISANAELTWDAYSNGALSAQVIAI